MSLISEEDRQLFYQVMSEVPESMTIILNNLFDEITVLVDGWSYRGDFRAPAKNVEILTIKRAGHLSKEDRTVLKRALAAKFALRAPEVIHKMNLPDSVLSHYPITFNRLANYLRKNITGAYDSTDEYFCKDIRFVLLMTVPCGAWIVDLVSSISWSSVILSSIKSRSLTAAIRWLRAGGSGIWLRRHLDSRYLDEFNEQGNDKCFHSIAELLMRRKHVRGIVGTSWFYDPMLSEISPHLAFLRQRPLERGAFLMRHGSGQIHIKRAIQSSATRRRMFEEGKYIPICYSLLWPRNELIAWAGSVSLIE